MADIAMIENNDPFAKEFQSKMYKILRTVDEPNTY